MKSTLTSFDIAAVVVELSSVFKKARIQNIYQLRGNIFILKLHLPGKSSQNLLIESGRRLHLTQYLFEKPQNPPAFCMALRKYLRNGFIENIEQFEFERIVIINIRIRDGEFKLVIELFGDGNAILVDSQGIIKHAFRSKKMRDRKVFRGELFEQPPSSGKNPLHITLKKFSALKKFRDLEIVKALTKFLSIGGAYSEEILLRAHVNMKKSCELLEKSELERIFNALEEIILPLKAGNFEPRILIDKKKVWVDFTPIPLKMHENLEYKSFGSFNESLDEYYSKAFVEKKAAVATEKAEEKIARQQRILRDQQKSLKQAEKEAKEFREIGDRIYSHFNQLQVLLQTIISEKQGGKTWEEIVSGINRKKESGVEPFLYFKTLDGKKLIIQASIKGSTFSLNLRRSVQENAAKYYEQAKKTEKKVAGAQKALEETLNRINGLKVQKEIDVKEKSMPVKKRRKKAWFEKFRWFYTSENLLVVGGKDAVTNEILIKKHTEPHDLVFHADLAGAPFVLLKTEGKKPSQQSISEAAQLAASHSRAWKAKFSAIDVYWTKPEQVSKTPPTGEYLPRGAFMIRGKKNYIRKTPLRLAVGANLEKSEIIGGPAKAVQSKTNVFVEIIPGELSSSKLAYKIRHLLKQKAPRSFQDEISKMPIEDIQVFIPYGKGEVKRR